VCVCVTQVCGHTFCRSCLVRVLDHNPACPTLPKLHPLLVQKYKYWRASYLFY